MIFKNSLNVLKKRKKIFFLLIFILLIFKGCGGQFNQKWKSEKKLKILANQGNKIVISIEAYKIKTGKYPNNLDKLIPEFLKFIPTPNPKYYENKFRYRVSKDRSNDEDSFVIMVFPKQFFSLGQRYMKRVIYLPNKDYTPSKYRKIHKVVDGWSAETKYREYRK